MGYRTVVVSGLDLSLTSTGIARITWEPNGHVQCDTTKITSTGSDTATLLERIRRIRHCRKRIVDYVSGSDLVVVEGPVPGSSVAKGKDGHRHDRSGLWHEVLGDLDEAYEMPLAEIAPTARAKYATGNGQAPKDAVLAAAIKRYTDWDITGHDVGDAVVILAMACRWIGRPIDKVPQLHASAMTKVRWPDMPVGLGK